MIALCSEELRNLFLGSAFFACGGGVPYEAAVALMCPQAQGNDPLLASINEFSAHDCLCTVYAIGASGKRKKDYRAFLSAIKHLEEILTVPIKGLVPGEIGSEVNALWVARELGIPVVDADMVGGRAVPEDQMDVFGIFGISSAPMAVVNDRGDALLVKVGQDPIILEDVYRAFAVASGGYCYLAGSPMRQMEAKKILPSGTVSRALRAGQALHDCRSPEQAVEALAAICDTTLLAAGVVSEKVPMDQPGFLSGIVRIRGTNAFKGHSFDLHYKNENIILLRGGECLCSVPDLLSLLDAQSSVPIQNANLREGMNVLVLGTPALPVWHSERGIALFGPARFGFSHEYIPLARTHSDSRSAAQPCAPADAARNIH